jgi:hypothetical protein
MTPEELERKVKRLASNFNGTIMDGFAYAELIRQVFDALLSVHDEAIEEVNATVEKLVIAGFDVDQEIWDGIMTLKLKKEGRLE